LNDIKYNWTDEVILIADDDHYSFLLLEKILKRTGAKILCANDGKEAINICLKDHSISMAIIDIRMPFYDGFEVVKEVRKYRMDILFIAQTADIFRVKKEKENLSFFAKVFQKPFLPVKFLEELHEILVDNNKIIEITDN
jgi:CheY-like chemotaxis protein